MIIDTWIVYVGTIFVVILIPGPLSLYMVSNTLDYGLKKSAPAFLGGVLASTSYLILSATGLGVLLTSSQNLFLAVKVLGAIYLVYLGVSTWVASNQQKQISVLEGAFAKQLPSFKAMFSKAFFLGASNPKDILFFIAFLPQFISTGQSLTQQLVIIVASWVVVDLLCKLLYGVMAHKIKPYLTTAKSKEIFDKITAVIFIAAGISATFIS